MGSKGNQETGTEEGSGRATKMIQPIEHNNQRVLTTAQLAEAYGTTEKIISQNFTRNKDHYLLGKHYFVLEGEEKRQFLNHPQFEDGSKNAKRLSLWTEKGALLHAKSLGTDKAWEVYETLVDEYYRLVQQLAPQPNINKLWEERLILFNQKNKIPDGYWCIFGFVAGNCYMDSFRDINLTESAVPDISVGLAWCKYLRSGGFDLSLVKQYLHRYPDKRGTQQANIYPNEWLGTFWNWFQSTYLKEHYPKYLQTHQTTVPIKEE